MASRSSMYGSIASMIPNWVFGGDYGDISNQLNARELSYENLARTQLANDQERIDLERKQRAQELEQMLAEQFQANRPATIRDAYATALDTAFNVGDVDSALKYQNTIERLDDMARQQKFEDLKGAGSLAQIFDYNRVNEVMPGVLSPEEASRIFSESRRRGPGDGESRGGGATPRASDYTIVMDRDTGFVRRMLWPDAEAAQANGNVIIRPSADDMARVQLDIRRRQAEEAQSGNSSGSTFGSVMDFLNPTAPLPMARPSPTPADARGDRARQGPSVGDQVKVIKRERSVKR